MTANSIRISSVTYDAARRHYVGDVTFADPDGITQIRVSTPGLPGWDTSARCRLSAPPARARASLAATPGFDVGGRPHGAPSIVASRVDECALRWCGEPE